MLYMSIKKLSFYLTDVEITLRSDHLPLKNFLLKNTLNSKVNNWAVELETFNIKFEHISGIKNMLADTLSRIIKVDPDVQSECERKATNSATLVLKNCRQQKFLKWKRE